MVLNIGICDDNQLDIQSIRKGLEDALANICIDYKIVEYQSGNEIAKKLNIVENFDILILDIDMPGIDGIEIAKRLMDSKVNIIFATNHEELVFEAIHSRPFRFIRKEKLSEELCEALPAVVEKIRKETILYDFGNGRDSYKLRIVDVDYIESNGHYIHIHTRDKVVQIRGKISLYEEKLKDYGFIRVHLGFLVNVRSIYSITSKGVTLDDGKSLPISRKNVEKIKLKHANYVRRFIRGVD